MKWKEGNCSFFQMIYIGFWEGWRGFIELAIQKELILILIVLALRNGQTFSHTLVSQDIPHFHKTNWLSCLCSSPLGQFPDSNIAEVQYPNALPITCLYPWCDSAPYKVWWWNQCWWGNYWVLRDSQPRQGTSAHEAVRPDSPGVERETSPAHSHPGLRVGTNGNLKLAPRKETSPNHNDI